MAWLIDRSPRWAAVLGAAQLGLLALLYIPHNFPGFPAMFSRRAALTCMVALALLAWTLRTARTAGAADASPDVAAGDRHGAAPATAPSLEHSAPGAGERPLEQSGRAWEGR
jgi:hypothetical protein